jgi:hypothetical protein
VTSSSIRTTPPHIRDLAATDLRLEAAYDAVGRLLVGLGATDLFCVGRAHSHFPQDDDQVQLVTADVATRELWLDLIRLSGAADTTPIQWAFAPTGDRVTLAVVDTEDLQADPHVDDILDAVGRLLADIGATDLVTVSRLYTPFPVADHELLYETTEESEQRQNLRVIPFADADQAAPTQWRFDTAGRRLAMTVCNNNKTWH